MTTMKNWRTKLSTLVRMSVTGSCDDLFGLCPECLNKKVEFVFDDHEVYFVCHRHKVYWLNEVEDFRPWEAVPEGTDLGIDIDYRESYTAVEPWRRPRWMWLLDRLHTVVRRLAAAI